jgi:hypothetical protein
MPDRRGSAWRARRRAASIRACPDFAQPDLDLFEAGPVRHEQGQGVAVRHADDSARVFGGRQRPGQQQEDEEGEGAREGVGDHGRFFKRMNLWEVIRAKLSTFAVDNCRVPDD